MDKKRLSDEEFLEVIREVHAWKKRDAERSVRLENWKRKRERNRKIRIYLFTISGVAAVILVLLWIPWKGHNSKTQDELYQEFYSPYQFATDYRDAANHTVNLFSQAVRAYRDGNWYKAELLSDSLTAVDHVNPDYLLINGLVKIATGKYSIAIEKLNAVIPNGGSYEINARWYLALALLKEGKIMECRNELMALKDLGSSYFKNDVNRLLRKLEHLNDQL
ncbi:MAG: hypothetical protein WC865_07690 [Bacteroidales bacterium]